MEPLTRLMVMRPAFKSKSVSWRIPTHWHSYLSYLLSPSEFCVELQRQPSLNQRLGYGSRMLPLCWAVLLK